MIGKPGQTLKVGDASWIQPLRWQQGRPDKPGWYWISGKGTWRAVIQYREDQVVWLGGSSIPHDLHDVFDEHDGIADKFAGPIPEPST